MKITILTAGTGSYYCGACMRDNALAKALIAAGHEAHLVPMYLPLQLDEERIDAGTPVFFGGINVYLQQKFRLFRALPRWCDKLFNGRKLLEAVARRSHMTSAREQGEMTYQMLQLESSHLDKEVDKLVDWLERDGLPDVVLLSNSLLAGLIRELKSRLKVPVVCTFQGEDGFLDTLPDPWREKSWQEMAVRVREADALISPSQFYADLMSDRLNLEPGLVEIIPNGIDLTGYGEASGKLRIGYLARMTHSKGLGTLVDAFIYLNDPEVTLAVAGTLGGGDEDYLEKLKSKLKKAGLDEQVEWHPKLSREAKADFLKNLTLFTVPVSESEAFGLFLVEAMACSLPVVMPRACSFPEIIEAADCGILVEPNSPEALAGGLREALDHPELETLGKNGRRAVEERYHLDAMAAEFIKIFQQISK